ncbi:Cytochrome c oxidase subunit 3 [Rosistilla oblonga]|uniref:Cytochrome c oxidase subunit 3 n=2 Tax=Rosistilla TaxID=2795779 RepID=A0A518IWV2_9BACT|nr:MULTISPECIES: cytochrome c oxidase subunit 3 [Rosistilla]QDS90188.1 Cytochrome c oxidase subunit 3 [Rosistilla ulvae]QDV14322.1 Cytochrome c oxidase subunit 3 [Rosistilla oblonga]QDV57545.1 Cytochrome c oxidase subunit 3 [Rosistilla oblonga]
MATAEIDQHGHAHDEHEHPSFLAHHFETPEQQYDSGKLGMWLFLVTEILFFSGLFCAYAIYRSLRPEVYTYCSQFLNTELGAINTGVLLFSSLTMAWAVRAAQLEQHKTTVGMLAATISCAMIFLGVKAVEYSHKFDLGLLPAGFYHYDPAAPHHEGLSHYLVALCVVPAIVLAGMICLLAYSKIVGNVFLTKCAMPLVVAAACFFVGVGLGTVLENRAAAKAAVAHAADSHSDATHEETSLEADVAAAKEITTTAESSVLGMLATDATNTGVRAELEALQAQDLMATGEFIEDFSGEDPFYDRPELDVNSNSLAGVFFSIYYCMTGLHAIHIIIGIGVLVWLLVRAVRQDFCSQYFGPVDYVGLYWHIVDLIWIYLFPLLYLIG